MKSIFEYIFFLFHIVECFILKHRNNYSSGFYVLERSKKINNEMIIN